MNRHLFLLPRPGLFPYIGQFSFTLEDHGIQVEGVGEIGGTALEAWEAIKRILKGIREVPERAGSIGRHQVLTRVWERVLTLPRHRMGPAHGDDLCLILLARDVEGASLSGCGVGGLWCLSADQTLIPLPLGEEGVGIQPGVPNLPRPSMDWTETGVLLGRGEKEGNHPPGETEILQTVGGVQ